GRQWSGAVSLVLLACSLCALVAPAASATELLNAYVTPYGVCRVILHNDGDAILDLAEPAILDASGSELPRCWAIAEPYETPPGAYTILSYLPEEAGQHEGPPGHVLAIGGERLPVPFSPAPLAATYAVHATGKGRVYCYIANESAKPYVVKEASIANAPVSLSHPAQIPPHDKGLVHGAWERPESLSYSVPPVTIKLVTAEGEAFYLFARLFSPEHTCSFEHQASKDTAECLTHSFENARAAADSAIRAGREWRLTRPRTVRCCNVDLSNNGPELFGQLTDRLHIEPQLTFAEEYRSGEYAQTFLDAFRTVKRATEPGMFYAQLYADDIHSPGSPLYGLTKMRTMAYLSVAAGGKGIELRPGLRSEIPLTHRRGLDRLAQEFNYLQPLIAVSEPVGWAHVAEDAWCTAHAVQCGDQGALLILIPKRELDTSESEVSTTIDIAPAGIELAGNGEELGGQNRSLVFERGSEGLRTIASLSVETHVYFLPASREESLE
ncbi:MAG: hypothetical protein JXR94_22605, partial [Candidatus Hydrogenedentes bacterium]|nr:hypothetical protein [Candidatus Hydrogenedentota bacterium]